MGLNTFSGMLLCLILLSLAAPSLQVNWQGTGDMNETVMAQINQFANSPYTSTMTAAMLDGLANTFANTLNGLWDPAWNVFIVKEGKDFDTVVYGYAFRNHWAWINGIALRDDTTKVMAIVVWKDYNCHHWAKVNVLAASTTSFTSTELSDISTQRLMTDRTLIPTDIWSYAHRFISTLWPSVSSRAYSIVMSQDKGAVFSGYICLVDNYYQYVNNNIMIESTLWGSLFLFRTR